MRPISRSARLFLAVFLPAAAGVGTPEIAAAQQGAIRGYGPSTVDVGWGTGPGDLFGPGFTFTPTSAVFVTALSFFNPDDNGGALGFSASGDPSLASVFTVVLAQVNASGNATALTWATIDNSSVVTPLATGGITGAFFSAVLGTPYALQAGHLYTVFGGTDQGLVSFGAGWDAGTTPPNPVTSPLIAFGNFIGGESSAADLGAVDGVTISGPPDPSIAFSTGAAFQVVTTTPEPASMSLTATGLMALICVFRRRSRSPLSQPSSPGTTHA